MSKRSGKYTRGNVPVKKLNVSSSPITIKSTNQMKKKTSKSFRTKATLRRMGTGQKRMYTSAVKAARIAGTVTAV